ncbi:hypothetical protein [Clostridium scatologenes]|uniref:WXG100 family type VII secretion target n=1 Tax=Clostridium scatologenes TaxID=1548 RepID=A0A0E3M7L0_CLOSL|nr:hypothetical protein [Clostridium scatologenes]AKA70478.1 hypothetical protein CSCA_3353 [Clostridium scatologenes]
MDFELDIGELTNTIREYENVIKDLEEQKENINKVIKELTDLGWSGEAKDKFMEIHIKKQEFYTKLIEDIKYEKNALENEEKPRAIQLKKRCEDFENCIKRSTGGAALTNDDTGVISLQYGGQFPINNNINECTDNYYRQMNSKFVEILNLANSLSFTTFPIGGDVESAQNSLRNQTTSLTEFDNSFNAYCNGIRDMEENICSVFSKISGITEEISQIRGMSIISESGQVDKNKVMQLMLKNPAYLTKEEKEILEYAKIVLGEDEYKKIKETVFTYKEAEKYIKCDILGFNVGLKTYSSNEIFNLPSQITYEKGGYIYTYVLTENSPPTFNGVELPNDDIITKDGQVISTKTYGYKLAYTNEPKISTGIVFVSPIEGVGKATVWGNITGTAKNMQGTEIPATFQIKLREGVSYTNPTTGSNVLWTNANATEHMGEYVSRFGTESESIGIRSQEMLESYSASLNKAMADLSQKAPGRYFETYGNWELGINTETGVVYHAKMLK